MNPVSYLLSTSGRTGRPGMWLITGIFFGLAVLRVGLQEQGVSAEAIDLAQLVLLWPAAFAIPVKRFHDMGRPSWWVLIFLGGIFVSFLFLILELTSTAGYLGLSAFAAITDEATYMSALAEFNAARSDAEPLEPVGAMGLGGVSLGMIFFLVQFGWLHFIPGNRGENNYGPRPGAATR